jgi:acetyl esterase
VRALLDVISAAFPRLGTEVVDAARARALVRKTVLREPRPLARVDDLAIPDGPPVRVYRPSPGTDPLPALVFLHGGGFVICDLDSHDGLCRDLAAELDCVVVSVDYRRAPEHPFPAAADDAVRATGWTIEQAADLGIDPARIGVAGDSAGGNLAAVVAQRFGGRLAVQLLLYPMLDPAQDTASYRDFAQGYFVTADHLRWYWDCYRGGRPTGTVVDRDVDRDPAFAPLAAESLGGLAPAVIAVAGLDPLGDEGREYARRLAIEGTPTQLFDCAGLFHGFAGFGEQLPEAAEAMRGILAAVRPYLA